MALSALQASWLRRGAVVLMALWLVVEVPIVCQHGPMGLFDRGARGGQMQHGMGVVGHGEADAGRRPGSLRSIPAETAVRLILVSSAHQVFAASLQTVSGLCLGALPVPAILPPLAPELALAVIFLLLYRLLPESPPDQPPRPWSPARRILTAEVTKIAE